jgi:hypothetical protein
VTRRAGRDATAVAVGESSSKFVDEFPNVRFEIVTDLRPGDVSSPLCTGAHLGRYNSRSTRSDANRSDSDPNGRIRHGLETDAGRDAADAERVERIAAREKLQVWRGDSDVTADEVRARGVRVHREAVREPTRRARLRELARTADLKWLANFLAEEQRDIHSGLQELRLAIDRDDDERADRIRRETHAQYPFVVIPDELGSV